MDKQLEEQLERVRQLSARVARLREEVMQNHERIAREREQLAGSPLSRVRDFRPWTAPPPPEPSRQCDDGATRVNDDEPRMGGPSHPRRRRPARR